MTDRLNKPKITILIPTYNRRRYLPFALRSALAQNYSNIEVIVINDGGQDVSDIVGSASDSRIIFIDRKLNRGKAYSLNEGLSRASGKYVAYLDDDDMYYPNHVSSLVDALENQEECQAAYSDLYKVHCREDSSGNRQVLSKILEVSRDFDRFFMLHFNHVLHVSLMHRRDLLEKTGPYNEDIKVMIDWDMTRRLMFFTDFIHVHEITGEYFGPVGECDRISVQMRKNATTYLSNMLMIRTSRPAKPWPKMPDLSLLLVPEKYDKSTDEFLRKIWLYTCHVFKLILPVPANQLEDVTVKMPNLQIVAVPPQTSYSEKLDAALEHCQGEYTAVFSPGIKLMTSWVEDSLYALLSNSEPNLAMRIDGDDTDFSAVFRTAELSSARAHFGRVSLLESLKKAGFTIRKPLQNELPFRFDDLLNLGRSKEEEGDYLGAGQIYDHVAGTVGNELWMLNASASAYFKAQAYDKAMERVLKINQVKPTADSMILQAKIHKQQNNHSAAINMFEQAKAVIEGTQPAWK